MVVPSVRDAHLLRMNNSLPRGYLSGPRPLSDAIPGAPASAVFPAIIIVSENQRPPLHMGWRGHLLRSLASPSLPSPWDQPRGPGSPLADRAAPRRLPPSAAGSTLALASGSDLGRCCRRSSSRSST